MLSRVLGIRASFGHTSRGARETRRPRVSPDTGAGYLADPERGSELAPKWQSRTAMLDTSASSASSADRAPRDVDVVSQIRVAFRHPLPLTIGALLGALVPIGTYTVGHLELDQAGWVSVPGVIVVGGLSFSAITVYKWGARAFASGGKALGFVLLSEGIMSFSHIPWLSVAVLAVLVAVNAIANGAHLAAQHLAAVQAPQARDPARASAPAAAVVDAAQDAMPGQVQRRADTLLRTVSTTATPAEASPLRLAPASLPAPAETPRPRRRPVTKTAKPARPRAAGRPVDPTLN